MPLSYTPITELEAVNAMLEMVSAAPVSSLPDSGVSEAYLARSILHRVSREIQSMGWSFNTDENYELSPNSNGFIILPTNVLRIDATYRGDDYVPRYDSTDSKMKLYNKAEHTFIFSSPVKVDVVWFFPWDGLPDHVRNYVYIKAARQFQVRFQTNEGMHKFTEADELYARAEMLSTEFMQDDDTLFYSPETMLIIKRRL